MKPSLVLIVGMLLAHGHAAAQVAALLGAALEQAEQLAARPPAGDGVLAEHQLVEQPGGDAGHRADVRVAPVAGAARSVPKPCGPSP